MKCKLVAAAIAATMLSVVQPSFAVGAKEDQTREYGLAEIMANSLALQTMNKCSGRGKDVLDACSEMSLAWSLQKLEKAIDASVLGGMPKGEFVAQVYERAKRALAAMKQPD